MVSNFALASARPILVHPPRAGLSLSHQYAAGATLALIARWPPSYAPVPVRRNQVTPIRLRDGVSAIRRQPVNEVTVPLM